MHFLENMAWCKALILYMVMKYVCSESCTSRYHPYFNGTCMDVNDCEGGTLSLLCTGGNNIKCCIEDPSTTPVVPSNPTISQSDFLSIAGNTTRNRALYPYVEKTFRDANLSTCHQKAAFLGQMGEETGDFKYFEEMSDGSQYEGRTDLGNTQTGDGPKFRGRGVIHLTGRYNYQKVQDKTGYPITTEPEQVALPKIAFNTTVWMWKNGFRIIKGNKAVSGSLTELCDGTNYNFHLLTYAINGGLNGLDQRILRWKKALKILKCSDPGAGSGPSCIDNASGYTGYCMIKSDCVGEETLSPSCPKGPKRKGSSNPVISCCTGCHTPVDLVFVMDSSGSVGGDNFEKEKDFVLQVVNHYDVGTDDYKSKIGIVRYASLPDFEITLDQYSTNAALKNAIKNIKYTGGGTSTHLALNHTYNTFFKGDRKGVRSREKGIPRVLVVITDGRNNDGTQVLVQPAKDLESVGVNIFAVGVGSGVNDYELKVIASDPDKDHTFHINSFDAILSFVKKMTSLSCYEPALIPVGSVVKGNVPQGQTRYIKSKFDVKPEIVTVLLTTKTGDLDVFLSLKEKNPSKITNNLKKVSSFENCRMFIVNVPPDQNQTIVYVGLKGRKSTNAFELRILEGERETCGSAALKPVTVIIISLLVLASSLI